MFDVLFSCAIVSLLVQSLSDRGSSSRQVSRPSSLGSSISDVRDEQLAASTTTQPSTPITAHPMAAAAAALASGAMTPNGDIDYKKVKRKKNTRMIICCVLYSCPFEPIMMMMMMMVLPTECVNPTNRIGSLDSRS